MPHLAMPNTNTFVLIALAVAVLVVIVVAIFAQYRAKRTRHLREHFGPEYERLKEAGGGARGAERELERREKRAAKLQIRELSSEETRVFVDRWYNVQTEFVDSPKSSLAHADELLGEVMVARGYPVQDFEQRAADLSVEHPVVVQHYHAAHGIALRHGKGEATTEGLRQAMIHYRALFDELVSNAVHSQAAE